jgi:hypothetical protein
MTIKINNSSNNTSTNSKQVKTHKNKLKSNSKLNLIENRNNDHLNSSAFKRKNQKVDLISRMNPIGGHASNNKPDLSNNNKKT